MPRPNWSKINRRRTETVKVSDILQSLGEERGEQNESFAQEICKDLVARGIIESFWPTIRNSRLDREEHIDIICKTPNGYYLVDVKSSQRGVDSLETRSNSLQFKIYPWLVVYYTDKHESERLLMKILASEPSCAILPEEIKRELEITPDMAAAIELEEMKRAVIGILSTDDGWHLRFKRLEFKKLCAIRKWEVVNNNEGWMTQIEVEIFNKIINASSQNRKKDRSLQLTAEKVKKQILALLK